jgi:ABC-type antimicrobial peptide transport system permease subunit
MIGLFRLMSFNVARRTKEIGIRMALGARRQKVLSAVMRESLLLVAIGVVIGVSAALALTRLMANFLFGLAPYEPLTIVLAVSLMLVGPRSRAIWLRAARLALAQWSRSATSEEFTPARRARSA